MSLPEAFDGGGDHTAYRHRLPVLEQHGREGRITRNQLYYSVAFVELLYREVAVDFSDNDVAMLWRECAVDY